MYFVVYPHAKAEINIICPPNKGPRNPPSNFIPKSSTSDNTIGYNPVCKDV